MSTAFQPDAFQTDSYQIDTSDGLLGGKAYAAQYPYYQIQEQERLSAKRAELKQLDEVLAAAEQEQQEARKQLAEAKEAKKQENAAKQLAALEASLQEEINRLRMERVWLMRLIDDEEAILVLLLSLPLH